MSEPVLNSMFIYPNMDNLTYHIPFHENMELDWITKRWFVYDIYDAEIENDNQRTEYDIENAEIDDVINNLHRDCYIILSAKRY